MNNQEAALELLSIRDGLEALEKEVEENALVVFCTTLDNGRTAFAMEFKKTNSSVYPFMCRSLRELILEFKKYHDDNN